MLHGKLVFIGAVFALAGLIKGVIGLGLPTVSMGLLAIVMPPLQAAAILVLPSFLTNVWQMVGGPSLPAQWRAGYGRCCSPPVLAPGLVPG
jgi:uncharacterized protein